jgi:hypothetical protein
MTSAACRHILFFFISPSLNCVLNATGLGSYMNVAVTDPLQQLGLAAFDDRELAAAAAAAAKAQLAKLADTHEMFAPANSSSSSGQSKHVARDVGGTSRQTDTAPDNVNLLYLAAFSRDCSGNAWCQKMTRGLSMPPSHDMSSKYIHSKMLRHYHGLIVMCDVCHYHGLIVMCDVRHYHGLIFMCDVRHYHGLIVMCDVRHYHGLIVMHDVCWPGVIQFPCKTLSTSNRGPRPSSGGSATTPYNRPLMTLSRIYVNPATGQLLTVVPSA